MTEQTNNIYTPITSEELILINVIKQKILESKSIKNLRFLKRLFTSEEIEYIFKRTIELDLDTPFRVRLSWIYNDLKFRPKCKVCGRKINFSKKAISPYSEFKYYCSQSCISTTEEYKQKVINTICDKTNSSSEGITNIFQLESIKERSKKTLQSTFNDVRLVNISQVKCRQLGYKNYLNNYYVIPLFSYEEYNEMCFKIDRYHNFDLKWKCKQCGYEFTTNVKTKQIKPDGIHTTNICCPKCYPARGCSIMEKQILSFIKSIYNKTVETNNRKILLPTVKNNWKYAHEIDIWMPDIKYAIEINGTYYHCDPRFYSENDIIGGFQGEGLVKDIWEEDKLKEITIKDLKLEYSVIWEYDWNNKQEEIKEMLRKNIDSFIVKYC